MNEHREGRLGAELGLV